jgi:hypothetical protein
LSIRDQLSGGENLLSADLVCAGGGFGILTLTNAFLDGVSFVGSVKQSEVSGITVQRFRSAGIDGDGQAPGTTGLTFTANTLGRNGTGILESPISKNDLSGNGGGR